MTDYKETWKLGRELRRKAVIYPVIPAIFLLAGLILLWKFGYDSSIGRTSLIVAITGGLFCFFALYICFVFAPTSLWDKGTALLEYEKCHSCGNLTLVKEHEPPLLHPLGKVYEIKCRICEKRVCLDCSVDPSLM